MRWLNAFGGIWQIANYGSNRVAIVKMAKDKDETPIINISAYHRDLYQLLTLLLADEKVAMNTNFKNLSESNHDNEVNRLLIWIAIATRQLLDIKTHSVEVQVCGQFYKDFSNKEVYEDLTFRQACNAIIHAVEILSYDPEDEETKEGTWKADYYKGTIIIRGKQGRGRRQRSTRALLNCEKFAEYCIFLSEEFTEEV